MNKDDPAFPWNDFSGLSTRDYIAIEAMRAYVSLMGIDYSTSIATKSYRLADAMLKESIDG